MQKGNNDYEKSAIERMKKNNKENGEKHKNETYLFQIFYHIRDWPSPLSLLLSSHQPIHLVSTRYKRV